MSHDDTGAGRPGSNRPKQRRTTTMGAWTGQYEGISKAKFEEMIAYAKAHGDKNMESFICCHASDEQGQYHDPETRAFWDEEERKDAAARVAQEARQTRVDKV